MGVSDSEFWYPALADVLSIHDDIISEDSDSEPGIENQERIQFALDYIEHGHYGKVPETIHEKAFHLMRLLASNHWFVDGNKRTALNTTEIFYLFNGYEFDYGEDIRSMLKLLAVRERLIEPGVAAEFFAEKTTQNPALPGGENADIPRELLLGTRPIPDSFEPLLESLLGDHND